MLRKYTNGNSEKRKLAVLIIAVTLAFYLSFLPYSAFILHRAFKERFKTGHLEPVAESTVLSVMKFLTVASCTLNPVLYSWQSEHYRKGFKRLFCRQNVVRRQRVSQAIAPLVTFILHHECYTHKDNSDGALTAGNR